MTDFLRKLEDPEIDQKKKINSNDYFELVYMRHRYFRKSTNPTPERLKEFEEMICNISDKIYYRNIAIFKTTGLESDDLKNIGRVNTVSFISMCGLKENPELMDKFIQDHKRKYGQHSEPASRDIFLRECYNLCKYLNQRLQEIAKFCQIKNANIIGDKIKKMYFLGSPNKEPSDESLMMFPESFGFKKIKEAQFKKMFKDLKTVNKTRFMTPDGQVIRIIQKNPNYNIIEDFYKDNSENESNLNPEELMIKKESLYTTKKLSLRKKV
jgi:hypothetical protein